MTISWTRLATTNLKSYYDFLKEARGVKFARKWRKQIFDKVGYLVNFPRQGIQETSVLYPDREFRSLLEGNFRIIYLIEGQNITIINIFDTRQNPDKLIF